MAKKQKNADNAPVSHGVGRRKSAVARIWLRRGNGQIRVNGQEHVSYFDTKIVADIAAMPFRVCPLGANFNADVNVSGGGKVAQADAVKLGIARAFVKFDESTKPVLKEWRLVRVDARVKERKKYGQRGARRKFQFTKR